MNYTLALPAIALSALIAAPALGDENFSDVHQLGSSNDGVVVQGPGSHNQLGTETLAARQSGDNNTLSILQSGNGNEIGTGISGFLQTSNRNVATITQSSSNNRVLNVIQTGIGDAVFGPDLPRNYLDLTQKGGDSNIVTLVSQTRTTLFAPIDPLPGNAATLSFDGSSNGVGTLGATDITGGWGGVAQGSVVQTGVTNALFVTTIGSTNLFGYEQDGEINGLIGSITGDGNETVVSQDGSGNIAGFSVTGSGNQLFFAQGEVGANLATVSLFGDANQIGVQQLGATNVAALTIDGDNNLVNAYQDGANDLFLDIWGDDNNSNPFTPGEPAALTAAPSSLQPGAVLQYGFGNSIVYTVGLTATNSNNNSFAFLQDGTGNEIIGATFGGNGNEVVIVQNGSSNFTSFSQHGSGNIIGVSQ